MDTNNNQPGMPSPTNPSDTPVHPGAPQAPVPPTTSYTPPPTNPVNGPTPNPTPPGPPPLETPIQHPTPPQAPPPTPPAGIPPQPHQSETPTPHTPSPAPADPPPTSGKKSMSKALLAGIGVLVIGAFSAVFIVANMQTGDTQNYADTTQNTPMPTSVVSPTIADANLTILTPTNNSTVNSATTTVTGKTFPTADVVINNNEVKADGTGNFSTTVTLDEGENIITVTATDEEGNVAEQEIMVMYEM